MKHKYTITGSYTTIHVVRRNKSIQDVIIDTIQLSGLLTAPLWVVPWQGGFYAVTTDQTGAKKYLHQLIAETPLGMHTDHINNNSLDNRELNLRVCTCGENQQNRLPSLESLSGQLGVTWHTAAEKWQARITLNRKRIFLGLFESLETAIETITAYRAKHMPLSKQVRI